MVRTARQTNPYRSGSGPGDSGPRIELCKHGNFEQNLSPEPDGGNMQQVKEWIKIVESMFEAEKCQCLRLEVKFKESQPTAG